MLHTGLHGSIVACEGERTILRSGRKDPTLAKLASHWRGSHVQTLQASSGTHKYGSVRARAVLLLHFLVSPWQEAFP